MTVNLSKIAKEDLIDIWLYGESNWGAVSADHYLDSLGVFIQTLTDFPEKFAMRRDFQPSVRLAPFRSHLVIYIDTISHIQIIRVLHQNMDIPHHL